MSLEEILKNAPWTSSRNNRQYRVFSECLQDQRRKTTLRTIRELMKKVDAEDSPVKNPARTTVHIIIHQLGEEIQAKDVRALKSCIMCPSVAKTYSLVNSIFCAMSVAHKKTGKRESEEKQWPKTS